MIMTSSTALYRVLTDVPSRPSTMKSNRCAPEWVVSLTGTNITRVSRISKLQLLRIRAGMVPLILNHPANRGKGGRVLVASAALYARSRLTGKPIETQVGGARMLAHVGVSTSTRPVYGSPPDWNEMHAWKRLLSAGDHFVDVGASVGIYSLWAADLGASVTAIEADPASLDLLRENIALNPGLDIKVVAAAVSAQPGRIEFNVGQWGFGSIGAGREVDAVTLDGILGDGYARGVKIDVEGYEQQILEGATRVLAERRVDALQLEWNQRSLSAVGADRRPVADMLEGAGYVLTRADEQGCLHPVPNLDFGADVFAVLPSVLTEVGSDNSRTAE